MTEKNLPTPSTPAPVNALWLENTLKPMHLIPAKPRGTLLQVSNIQLSDELMFELWTFMVDTFGRKWVEQYGEFCDENGDINGTACHWAQALARIPLPRLQRGLKKVYERRDSPFPPTLPEFYALCGKEPWE